jgi:NitT/TauT family transport system substrate-binding protein
MRIQHARQCSRRRFLGGLTLAGTAGLLGLCPRPVRAEPPPETTTLKLVYIPATCTSSQYIAEELLQAEGFTEVQYVRVEGGVTGAYRALASGAADLNQLFGGGFITRVDAGDPIVMLAGVHVGCFELFAAPRIRTLRDLKGKSVAVTELGSGRHLFFASMAAYVGLDPQQDIHWVTHPAAESMALFAEGKIDAFQAWPPEPQELRAKHIGQVLVNSAVDKPWSQYFCCMVAGNQEFVRKHPVATKRALRAILKATDLCALEPERVARCMVEKGYTRP